MATRVQPPLVKAQAGKEGQNLGAPNQTLYVKNLNDKINKNELKRALYMLFSTYGPVLDVVTTRQGPKGQNMRGQAHVVYRDVQTSTQALRALQNFDFLGKEMSIAYGKGQSQIVPKLRGTFELPTSTAGGPETTELQKSIFNAPPSSIPPKPVQNGIQLSEEPHGVKRSREEPEEEESDQDDVAMEEDEDDAPMDEDDDDD